MEQRRLLLFMTLSLAFLVTWSTFIAPRFFPNPKPAPKPDAAQEVADAVDPQQPADEQPAEPAENADEAPAPLAETEPEQPAAAEEAKLPEHPRREVALGSLDPASGFFLEAVLDSQGASVASIALNDERYRELDDREAPLKVVGRDASPFRTLTTSIELIDKQLAAFGAQLNNVPWEIVEEEADKSAPGGELKAVTFRFVTPDKKFEVRKRYHVERVEVRDNDPRETRDTSPVGYELHLELTVKNLSQRPEQVSYLLQGPIGVPLENVDNTRKFRDVKVGFLEDDGSTDDDSITAADIVKDEDEVWKRAFKYVGVDVQYFAALVLPDDDRPLEQQVADPYIAAIEQVVVAPARQPERSDVSVLLTSDVFDLAAGQELTHAYTLYAGPKRQELLAPLGAAAVLDYGWFGPVAKAMLLLLKTMHNSAAIPYGIAIVLMTILVRGCMFPLSLKQARGAKKMKELQPKIAELRKKYEKDKEKLARAQMELFSKHNYNPLAGCLPIFLQLPIFIGLYTALNSSVDLRMAPFLWIDNLAGPDALFRMPFSLPFLGRDFNLLPIVTVILFVIQQKMFMPPPTDEQQEMQQKMMMWMSIIFGFFFYHLPSGLCVYFIASSLWGFGERKLLDLGMFAEAPTEPEPSDAERPTKPADAPKPRKTGWWNRLLESADAAASDAGGTSGQGRLAKQLNGAKDKRKKSRPR